MYQCRIQVNSFFVLRFAKSSLRATANEEHRVGVRILESLWITVYVPCHCDGCSAFVVALSVALTESTTVTQRRILFCVFCRCFTVYRCISLCIRWHSSSFAFSEATKQSLYHDSATVVVSMINI